jgi:hypothetical protein
VTALERDEGLDGLTPRQIALFVGHARWAAPGRAAPPSEDATRRRLAFVRWELAAGRRGGDAEQDGPS